MSETMPCHEALLNLMCKGEEGRETALLSMGQTPGIANMQAKKLAEML
jgi:hypothetical protein